MGYDYLHVAVDDHSGVAYVRVFPDENGGTAARFLLQAAEHFAGLGVRIERVMTDRHRSYMLGRPSAAKTRSSRCQLVLVDQSAKGGALPDPA